MFMQVDVPMERWPLANWALIAGTCLVSLIVFVQETRHEIRPPRIDLSTLRTLENKKLTDSQKQKIILDALARAEPHESDSPGLKLALNPWSDGFHFYQLLTYQLVHADIWHLLGNMIFLFCFGNAICAKVGNRLYLPIYFTLGIFAGLAWMILGSGEPLVGASGAIMGITGMFLVLYPFNEVAIWTVRSLVLTGDAWRFPSWVVIVFYAALDLFGTVFASGRGGVAYLCHLGGSAAGIALASALIASRVIDSGRGEQNLLEAMNLVAPPERKPRRRRPRPRPAPIDPEE